jgi:mannose-1-phosphate guanylyltransferase
MKIKTVILCGGAGTRLWPISKQESPKQFAKLFNGESLFEKTVKRNQAFSNTLSVIVNATQLPLCKEQVPSDLKTDFIIEPVARNTAAAIALAAFQADTDEILLVLPSDHLIKDENLYKESLEAAIKFAGEDKLVTFGMKAQYPETGFGYIESDGNDVLSFKEKPDYETACEYVKKGNFYWNSGMFCFKASVFLKELEEHSNDIFCEVKKTYENKKIEGKDYYFQKEDMEKVPSNSIDYAVMEKSNNVNVVPSFFYWSDLGSYDSLYGELEKDEDGNTKKDLFLSLNSQNNLVIPKDKLIAAFDVEDLIIVDTDDAILIGKRGKSQNVKAILELVRNSGKLK